MIAHDVSFLLMELGIFLFTMSQAKPGMRKPVFTKVDQLRPGTGGHTLTVKVVSSKMVLQKGRPDRPLVRQMRIAECLVGDETASIVFTARNEQGISAIILLSCLTWLLHIVLMSMSLFITLYQSCKNVSIGGLG